MDGAQRYHHKRALGVSSTRFDGTTYDPNVDREAFAAEAFAASVLT